MHLFSFIPYLQSIPRYQCIPASTAGVSGPEEGVCPSRESALSAGPTDGIIPPDGPLGKKGKSKLQRLWSRRKLRHLCREGPR